MNFSLSAIFAAGLQVRFGIGGFVLVIATWPARSLLGGYVRLAPKATARRLESFGLRCVYSGDIRNGQDALALDHYGAADAIITNPPWSRDVLQGLITHFQNIQGG